MVEFAAPAGLYQWSVVADGRDFDWDSLYFNLTEWGNQGERTGPWDYAPIPAEQSYPVVPAYWVDLDGRRIGLWAFGRLSVEDITAKRFRGRMAFHLPADGRHTLRFQPFRKMSIRWVSAILQQDPDDRLEAVPPNLRTARGNGPFASWRQPHFWRKQRKLLEGTHRRYAPVMTTIVDWALARQNTPDTTELPALAFAYRALGNRDALARALETIDVTIELPHWSNPNDANYGQDGDRFAAKPLRALAQVWHILRDELGDTRSSRLMDKLRLQGQRFFERALLTRDYWGGSVLQDHGWTPIWAYLNAALLLQGELPEAELWLSWALPRATRALRAVPRDGVIPQSHYGKPLGFLHELAQCRDTYLHLSGHDLYDDGPFERVIDFLCQTCRPDSQVLISAWDTRDSTPMQGGMAFLNSMASKHRDGRAAWLAKVQLSDAEATQPWLSCSPADPMDRFWSFFTFNPTVLPAEPKLPARSLVHYPDSALVHFRDFAQDVTFALQCGPPLGYHAYRMARGPNDRLGPTPRAGHFVLYRGARSLLGTPLCGYRLHTHLGSCLMIDGQGQRHDVGYPMSMPDHPYWGHEIEHAAWDASTEQGCVRLNLTPVYPESLGVVRYQREFILRPLDRLILCRDIVVLSKPRKLSWLFQTCDDLNPRLGEDGLRLHIGAAPESLTVEPAASDLTLAASLRRTEVVHSYSTNNRAFSHARYDARNAVESAAVDFTVRW